MLTEKWSHHWNGYYEEQTKRKTDEHTKRETDEHTKRETDEHTKRETDEHTKRETDEHTKVLNWFMIFIYYDLNITVHLLYRWYPSFLTP